MELVLEVRDAAAPLLGPPLAAATLQAAAGPSAQTLHSSNLQPLLGATSLAPGDELLYSSHCVALTRPEVALPVRLQCRVLRKGDGAPPVLVSWTVAQLADETGERFYGEPSLARVQLAFKHAISTEWELIAVAIRPPSPLLRPILDSLGSALVSMTAFGQRSSELGAIADVIADAFALLFSWGNEGAAGRDMHDSPADSDLATGQAPQELRALRALLAALAETLFSEAAARPASLLVEQAAGPVALLAGHEVDWLHMNMDEWQGLAGMLADLTVEEAQTHLSSEAGAGDRQSLDALQVLCGRHAARVAAMQRLSATCRSGSRSLLRDAGGCSSEGVGETSVCGQEGVSSLRGTNAYLEGVGGMSAGRQEGVSSLRAAAGCVEGEEAVSASGLGGRVWCVDEEECALVAAARELMEEMIAYCAPGGGDEALREGEEASGGGEEALGGGEDAFGGEEDALGEKAPSAGYDESSDCDRAWTESEKALGGANDASERALGRQQEASVQGDDALGEGDCGEASALPNVEPERTHPDSSLWRSGAELAHVPAANSRFGQVPGAAPVHSSLVGCCSGQMRGATPLDPSLANSRFNPVPGATPAHPNLVVSCSDIIPRDSIAPDRGSTAARAVSAVRPANATPHVLTPRPERLAAHRDTRDDPGTYDSPIGDGPVFPPSPGPPSPVADGPVFPPSPLAPPPVADAPMFPPPSAPPGVLRSGSGAISMLITDMSDVDDDDDDDVEVKEGQEEEGQEVQAGARVAGMGEVSMLITDMSSDDNEGEEGDALGSGHPAGVGDLPVFGAAEAGIVAGVAAADRGVSAQQGANVSRDQAAILPGLVDRPHGGAAGVYEGAAVPQEGNRAAIPQGSNRAAIPQGSNRAAIPQGGTSAAIQQGDPRAATPQSGTAVSMLIGGQSAHKPQGSQGAAVLQGGTAVSMLMGDLSEDSDASTESDVPLKGWDGANKLLAQDGSDDVLGQQQQSGIRHGGYDWHQSDQACGYAVGLDGERSRRHTSQGLARTPSHHPGEWRDSQHGELELRHAQGDGALPAAARPPSQPTPPEPVALRSCIETVTPKTRIFNPALNPAPQSACGGVTGTSGGSVGAAGSGVGSGVGSGAGSGLGRSSRLSIKKRRGASTGAPSPINLEAGARQAPLPGLPAHNRASSASPTLEPRIEPTLERCASSSVSRPPVARPSPLLEPPQHEPTNNGAQACSPRLEPRASSPRPEPFLPVPPADIAEPQSRTEHVHAHDNRMPPLPPPFHPPQPRPPPPGQPSRTSALSKPAERRGACEEDPCDEDLRSRWASPGSERRVPPRSETLRLATDVSSQQQPPPKSPTSPERRGPKQPRARSEHPTGSRAQRSPQEHLQGSAFPQGHLQGSAAPRRPRPVYQSAILPEDVAALDDPDTSEQESCPSQDLLEAAIRASESTRDAAAPPSVPSPRRTLALCSAETLDCAGEPCSAGASCSARCGNKQSAMGACPQKRGAGAHADQQQKESPPGNSRAKRGHACRGSSPISSGSKRDARASAGGGDSGRVRRQSFGIGLDITGGSPVLMASPPKARSAVRERLPEKRSLALGESSQGKESSRQRRKRAVLESDTSGDEADGRVQRALRGESGESGGRMEMDVGREAGARGVQTYKNRTTEEEREARAHGVEGEGREAGVRGVLEEGREAAAWVDWEAEAEEGTGWGWQGEGEGEDLEEKRDLGGEGYGEEGLGEEGYGGEGYGEEDCGEEGYGDDGLEEHGSGEDGLEEDGFGEDGLEEEELRELRADARERELCSQGLSGGADAGGGGEAGDEAGDETEEGAEEWWQPDGEGAGAGSEEDDQMGGAEEGFGCPSDDAGGALAALPCEVCGTLVPAPQLSAHQAAYLGVNGWADAKQRATDTLACDAEPVPCAFCGVPQTLARLDAHESLCPSRARSKAGDAAGGVRGVAGQLGRPAQPVGNAPAGASCGAGPSRSVGAPLFSVKAGAMGSNLFSKSHSARPGQQQQPRPLLPQSLPRQRSRPQTLQDDIEESSSGDDFAPVGGREPSRQAQHHLRPAAPQPTRGQPSPAEAIFPHFRSLAALQRDGVQTAVDYLAQFTGKPVRDTGGAAGDGATGGGKRGKGKAAARKPRRNAWRNINGRNVYYDDQGKQIAGCAGYAKSKTAAAAANTNE